MRHIKLTIITLAVLLSAAGAFLIGVNLQNIAIFTSQSTEISASTIEQSIQDLSELVTLSYHYTDVGTFSDQIIWNVFNFEIPIFGGQKSFVISYDGEMKIGLDLQQVAVDVIGETIAVSMPPIKIISHVIKEDSVMLLDERSGLFNKISITDYTDFITEQKPKMEERIIGGDLFSQAMSNAEAQIRALILYIPGVADNYEIIFRHAH